MPSIAHLTDLHSGRHDDLAVAALFDSLESAAPDLIVIGGDLTQRSRRAEWRRARGWLEQLPAPWIATPGNHDIPLFDLPRRASSPFGRFREHASEDLEPSARVEGALVLCVRTASPRRRVEGAVERSSLALARELLGARGQSEPIALVTHHPLAFHPDSRRAGHTVIRGDELLGLAAGNGVDLLLSGHTHRPYGGSPFTVDVDGRTMVAAHGGTACSTRIRAGEPPSWQLVDLAPGRIAITPQVLTGDVFVAGEPSLWVRDGGSGWGPG